MQTLSDCDKGKPHQFCGEMFDKMENEDDYLNKIVISEKAPFHLTGKGNRHNGVQIIHMRPSNMCVFHQN